MICDESNIPGFAKKSTEVTQQSHVKAGSENSVEINSQVFWKIMDDCLLQISLDF